MQGLGGPLQQTEGVGVGIGHRVQGLARGIDQGLGVGQSTMVGLQLVPFTGLRGELVEFADLPLQAFALLLHRLLAWSAVRILR